MVSVARRIPSPLETTKVLLAGGGFCESLCHTSGCKVLLFFSLKACTMEKSIVTLKLFKPHSHESFAQQTCEENWTFWISDHNLNSYKYKAENWVREAQCIFFLGAHYQPKYATV